MAELQILCLSTLWHNKSSPPENATGEIRRNGTNSQVAHTNVVAHGNEDAHPSATNTTKEKTTLFLPSNPKEVHPLQKSLVVVRLMPFIRQCLSSRGLSSGATEIIETSWRTGTRKKYTTYSQKDIDPIFPPVAVGINFLGELFHQGIGYSALNTARSALSSIIFVPSNTTFGTHPLVCRFIKGAFELRPSLPRY